VVLTKFPLTTGGSLRIFRRCPPVISEVASTLPEADSFDK
jgi:hypothetical protein